MAELRDKITEGIRDFQNPDRPVQLDDRLLASWLMAVIEADRATECAQCPPGCNGCSGDVECGCHVHQDWPDRRFQDGGEEWEAARTAADDAVTAERERVARVLADDRTIDLLPWGLGSTREIRRVLTSLAPLLASPATDPDAETARFWTDPTTNVHRWRCAHCGALGREIESREAAREAADRHIATYHTDPDARPSIEDLIERSSLGTPEAKAARESVSPEAAAEIVRRANEGRPTTEARTCTCDGAAYYTPEQNAERTPFLVNASCPVHGSQR